LDFPIVACSGKEPVRTLLHTKHDTTMQIKRNAHVRWTGSGKEGKGLVNTQSGVLKDAPYSYPSRFGNDKGTNPEELVGAALAVRAAAPRLQEGAGVVLFSSVAARQGFLQHAPIATAKAAVEGLARSLAADLAPRVRVNVVAPSLTRTALAARFTANEPMQKAIAQLHALPRLGEAEDAAALAAFLMGADAGWITGQVFAVDGGRSTVRSRG